MIALNVKYKVDKSVDYDKFVFHAMRRMYTNAKLFGKVLEFKIRKEMRSGKYEANSEPWAAAKKSNRSLYHTGYTAKKVTNSVTIGKNNNFVVIKAGWFVNRKHLHSARRRGRGGLKTIVNWITTHQSWQPMAAERRAFWAHVPNEWKAQNPPTQHVGNWYSPARDFMSAVGNDPRMHALFVRMVTKSTKEVLEGKR